MSNRQLTIAIDAMGGENSPYKTLKGSEIFSINNKNAKLLFFGNREHQNLSCGFFLVSFEFGIEIELLLFVIFFERLNPDLNPSFKVSFNVKVPLEAPTDVSFCFDLLGTKASIRSSNLSLFPDCDAK